MPERPHHEALLNKIADLRQKVYGERWQLELDLLEKLIECAELEAKTIAVTEFANSLSFQNA